MPAREVAGSARGRPPSHPGKWNPVALVAVVCVVLVVGCQSERAPLVVVPQEVEHVESPLAEPGPESGSAGEAPAEQELTDDAPAGDSTAAPVQVSAAWVADVSSSTGVPARALQGYALAQLIVAEEEPECRLGWTTLAGIGWVESHHGTIGDISIGDDGRTGSEILGVPLDGSDGVAAIRDTDGGRLDQDTRWDRAVGPMQFIPSTWQEWAADGNGDGISDPHQIDDAALAAARYLCAGSNDMSGWSGWRRAILTYNNSEEYAHQVLAAANDYAHDSRG